MTGWHRNGYPRPAKNPEGLGQVWRHDDGRVIWQGHPNPLDNWFVYRVQWPDGSIADYSRLGDAKAALKAEASS